MPCYTLYIKARIRLSSKPQVIQSLKKMEISKQKNMNNESDLAWLNLNSVCKG